jgi:hypothetical protein
MKDEEGRVAKERKEEGKEEEKRRKEEEGTYHPRDHFLFSKHLPKIVKWLPNKI